MSSDLANADPLQGLLDDLRTYPGLLVAFSGGVDSALLLAAAVRVLDRDQVLAVTAVSASLAAAELDYARDFTARVGARHREVRTDEMRRDGYRDNSTSLCYFCKAELLEVVRDCLPELPEGSRIATGTNADDLVAGFRPGIRAASERDAVTPLADAGLTKEQVRSAARAWDLPVWDKPQTACLSSRIAYGIQISPSRLARVEAAEVALRESLLEHCAATANLRVRDLGDRARIEVDETLAGVSGPWRQAALQAVRAVGFPEVEIDPRGFRSGAMNEGQTPLR